MTTRPHVPALARAVCQTLHSAQLADDPVAGFKPRMDALGKRVVTDFQNDPSGVGVMTHEGVVLLEPKPSDGRPARNIVLAPTIQPDSIQFLIVDLDAAGTRAQRMVATGRIVPISDVKAIGYVLISGHESGTGTLHALDDDCVFRTPTELEVYALGKALLPGLKKWAGDLTRRLVRRG